MIPWVARTRLALPALPRVAAVVRPSGAAASRTERYSAIAPPHPAQQCPSLCLLSKRRLDLSNGEPLGFKSDSLMSPCHRNLLLGGYLIGRCAGFLESRCARLGWTGHGSFLGFPRECRCTVIHRTGRSIFPAGLFQSVLIRVTRPSSPLSRSSSAGADQWSERRRLACGRDRHALASLLN